MIIPNKKREALEPLFSAFICIARTQLMLQQEHILESVINDIKQKAHDLENI